MKIHLKIKECVGNNGPEIIKSKQLVSMLDDDHVFDAEDVRPYKKMLREIISSGYASKIYEFGRYSRDIDDMASQFSRNTMTQEAPVLYLFQALAYGLGWLKEEPTLMKPSASSTQKNKPLSSVAVPSAYPIPPPPVKQNPIPVKHGIKHMLEDDIAWFVKDDNWIGWFWTPFFLLSLAGIIVSVVVIIVCWFIGFGIAAIWFWLFWECLIVGAVSLIVGLANDIF